VWRTDRGAALDHAVLLDQVSRGRASPWIAARIALPGIAFGGNPRHPARIRRMPPLRLTDSQITAIFAAARPLAVQDRDPFLQEVASLLAGIADIGDGDVARAIRAVQRKHFDPPLSADDRAQPHHRGPNRRAVG
jgi:hypothetical protein